MNTFSKLTGANKHLMHMNGQTSDLDEDVKISAEYENIEVLNCSGHHGRRSGSMRVIGHPELPCHEVDSINRQGQGTL